MAPFFRQTEMEVKDDVQEVELAAKAAELADKEGGGGGGGGGGPAAC